eukprot:UN08410
MSSKVLSITVVVYFSAPPYFDRRKLAGYPQEILLLEQLCWRGQSTGGVTKVHNHGNIFSRHSDIQVRAILIIESISRLEGTIFYYI